MKKSIFLKISLAMFLLASTLHAQENFSFDFNRYTGGYSNYSEAKLKNDFTASKLKSIVGMNRASVGNKQLRGFYPKNKILGRDTGFRFERLLRPSNEGVLEYRVKFEDGFQWSKGGKLPGLAGSDRATGRGVFGCNDNRDERKKGFSTRLMWRERGKLIYYPYAPLHSSYRNNNNNISNDAKNRGQGRCGGDLKITDLQVGKWYTIKQYIKLNTIGSNGKPNRNGIVKVWINGKLELNYNDFVLAGTRSVKVNGIAFHTYRGGSTNDWASNKNGYAVFDDIKACTACKDVKEGSTGNTGNDNEDVNVAPTVSLNKPANNSTYTIGDTINLEATASDANGNLEKVNFNINGDFYTKLLRAPFKTTFKPTEAGVYKIIAKSFDKKGLTSEKLVTITVKAPNRQPTVVLTSPVAGSVYTLGETINLSANANDPDGNLEKVNFNINDLYYQRLNNPPFRTTFKPTEAGTYKIMARSFDTEGLTKEEVVTITVIDPTLSSNDVTFNKVSGIKAFPSPATSILNVVGITSDTPVTIVSLSGKIVMRERVSKNKTQIEVSGLAQGLYFLRIENGSNPKRITFIKK